MPVRECAWETDYGYGASTPGSHLVPTGHELAPAPAAFTQPKGLRGYIQHLISSKTGESEEQMPQEGVTRVRLCKYEGRVPEESDLS